ncbi:MAG: hypothetical protein HRF50_08515 [Phycisphaerae bacterium]|jgi:uncharacterized protein (UPF0335 family)
MSKLYDVLAVLSVSTVLALVGVVGVMYGQGRLDSENVNKIAEILRGEDAAATSQPTASQPAEAANEPKVPVAAGPTSRSTDELREQRSAERLRRAALERATEDLLAQKRLIDQALQELITREEALESEKSAWIEQQKKLREEIQDEGFERELQFVAKLAPKQAKEHVLRIWKKCPADAVRLFNALKVSTGQQILAQFKSAEELDILHELLEQIRRQEVERAAPRSGTTDNG